MESASPTHQAAPRHVSILLSPYCLCKEHVVLSCFLKRSLSEHKVRQLSIQLPSISEAKFDICSQWLGSSLKIVMSMTTGAGGLSISPQLNFRAIVSSDSPAFKLVNRIRNYSLELYQSGGIDFIWQKLYQLFCQGKAAPSDVTPDGKLSYMYGLLSQVE